MICVQFLFEENKKKRPFSYKSFICYKDSVQVTFVVGKERFFEGFLFDDSKFAA